MIVPGATLRVSHIAVGSEKKRREQVGGGWGEIKKKQKACVHVTIKTPTWAL